MTFDDLTSRPIHPFEDSQRIESLPVSALRPDWLATLERIPGDGLKGDGFPRNVLGVLMHNPDTFGPFLEYWVASKAHLHFSIREQEIVILRMGALYRSDYVFKHHVKVGREFGLTELEITAIRHGDLGGFTPREGALLELTDELVEHRTLRAQTWSQLRSLIRPVELVDLVALVSQYVLFALTNNVAQVQLEPGFEDTPGVAG